MATYIQRKNGWLVQIRRKWVLGLMLIIEKPYRLPCLNVLIATQGVAPLKKAARDLVRVRFWQREPLAKKYTGTIKQADAAQWRDARIASELSGSTVRRRLRARKQKYRPKDDACTIINNGRMLSSLVLGYSQCQKPIDWRANPDEETTDWRARRGRTAHRAWDESRSLPLFSVRKPTHGAEKQSIFQQLIPNRQLADTLAGCGKNCVTQCRGNWRHPRLSYATEGYFEVRIRK